MGKVKKNKPTSRRLVETVAVTASESEAGHSERSEAIKVTIAVGTTSSHSEQSR